jgi:predicted permease
MDTFWRDLRYGARNLAQSSSFTTITLLTLALGIGANTAIFTLLNGLILRDLPVHNPSRLVAIYRIAKDGREQGFLLSLMDEVERRQQVFSNMFGWSGTVVLTAEASGQASATITNAVTGDYYSSLGVRPLMGRLIEPADEAANEPRTVAVISYNWWNSQYHQDPAIIGKIVELEGVPFSIIGVTPKEFFGLEVGSSVDVTIPMATFPNVLGANSNRPASDRRRIPMNYAVGQLKPGISVEQASMQMQVIWPEVLTATVPPSFSPARRADYLATRFGLKPAANGFSFLRDRFTKPLHVLMALSGLMLLVTCGNLASLSLARAASRGHEFAVRSALGASRLRIFRQVLTESLLLSATGAMLGLVLAGIATPFLAKFMWTGIGQLSLNLAPDVRVLSFCISTAVLTGILFGLVPAWSAVREDPNIALHLGAQTLGRVSSRLGKSLVVVQVALSLVLLVAASLFVRSLGKLREVPLGFRTQDILEVDLMTKPDTSKEPESAGYYQQLLARIRSLPGVLDVAMSHTGPGVGHETRATVGAKSAHGEGELPAVFEVVTSRFLETMGLNLLQGRAFNQQDDAQSPRVAIVTQALASRLFSKTGDPLGQTIRVGDDPTRQNIEIVGVVSDVRVQDLHDPLPLAVFIPGAQEPRISLLTIEVRTAADPTALTSGVREALEALGRQYALKMRTAQKVVNDSLVQERMTAMLAEFFGGLALLLAVMGLYSLTSYTVGQSTRAIGLRMALGSTRLSILWLVLRETLLLTVAGISIGLPCAVGSATLIAHLLFGLSPYDAVTLAMASCALLTVGLLAGFLPASRASSVDPMVALRHE